MYNLYKDIIPLSTHSKAILRIHSKNMIPMSATERADGVPWDGWTMGSTHTEHHWNHHHTQSSPSTFTQHTWNLFQKTHFCDAGLWIDRAGGRKFDGCFRQLRRESIRTGIQLCALSPFSKAVHLPSTWMGSVSSGPDANPGTWILKPAQPNLPAFRDTECLAPVKTSAFSETSNMSQAQEAMMKSYGL